MPPRNYSGRHGSGAWLRWFKRRYRSTNLPVVQNQMTESFLPALIVFQTERIIFIMIAPSSTNLTPDDGDNDGVQNFVPESYKPQQIGSSIEQQFPSLTESAMVAAQMKADMLVDQEIANNGSEAIFSEKRLKLNINSLFDEFFRGLTPDERRLITRETKENLKGAFADEYLTTIKEKVEGYRKDGTLYDEQILKIRELVGQDKSDFGDLDPPELLRYLAAVRAMEDARKITIDVTLKDLHTIRDYVEEYRKQYNLYDLSKEVINRSIGTSF